MNVTIREITIKPKNISKKKFFFISRFAILPYPDIDNESKKILTINISM